jgi:hypothetical protein
MRENDARRGGVTRRAFVTSLAAAAAGPAFASDEPPEKKPKLSPAGEAYHKAVLAKHGEQFTEEQADELKKQLLEVEETSAKLAKFPLEENSEPAMFFRVYRKEGR